MVLESHYWGLQESYQRKEMVLESHYWGLQEKETPYLEHN